MKKIKVKIHGHPLTDTFGYSFHILSILKKHYDVELSEDPEYLFYTDSFYEHYKYTCVKIYYTGENISPNFNHCDYAISFDYMQFEDRHYRMPLYLLTVFYSHEEEDLVKKDYLTTYERFTKEDLSRKKDFCSFVYSNYRSEKEREEIFNLLQSYKRVNSAGSYLNNTNGKKIKNKLSFELQHKFSIAFENSSRSGYTTEKLASSLAAKTIPIYWGNPNINKEFNTKRFINCHEYSSFKEVLKKVKELDTNDELYLSMINEPITISNYNFTEVKEGLEIFIKKIVDQPLQDAFRKTINPVQALHLKKMNKLIAKYVIINSFLLTIVTALYKPFKKIKFFENLKHAYFRKK